jgi:hypothetical protein
MEKYCEGEGITTLQDIHKLPKILINYNARKSAESLVKIHNLLYIGKLHVRCNGSEKNQILVEVSCNLSLTFPPNHY